MKKVIAIIVTFNASQWIDKCFSSLRESEYPVEIIVIDNNSTDNTLAIIKSNYPEVNIFKNNANLGFAQANNIGIKNALDKGADYVFLLNQDAWIEKNTIKTLIDTFETVPNAGIVSPVHLNGNYTGLDYGFASYMLWEFVSDAYYQQLKPFYKVPFVNAAAWMLSTECIRKVGGFDTSLFTHYGEDNNYCQRTLFHKFDILVSTECTICHDRVQRLENLSAYRDNDFTEDNERLMKKIDLGNINLPFDLKFRIKYLKRDILKSIISMKFSNIKSIRKEMQLMQEIQDSREKNKKGELAWL